MAPAAAATDTGRVREGNEDAYGLSANAWVVADGMGGHAGGEVAARVAVDAALTAPPVEVVAVAHSAVLAATTPGLADMGTTLVHAVLLDGPAGLELQVRWVGDSRAYLLVDAGMHRLTHDHNQAEALLADGHITAEQARVHPGQYRLTRALGLGRSVPPEPGEVTVPARGRLLLCTDGLTSEVDDDDVAMLLTGDEPGEAARRLVRAAVQAGGRDNVTVVVVDLPT